MLFSFYHRVATWTTKKLVHHDWFEKFFVIVIIFNCAIMATETSKNKDDHHSLSHTVEIYLLSLYTLEMFLKILGNKKIKNRIIK